MNSIDYVRKTMPQEELLTQLAEECAELSKAALKYRRALDGKNPTPVSKEAAYENLIEEIADIELCLEVLGLNTADIAMKCGTIMSQKADRWKKRLIEKLYWR